MQVDRSVVAGPARASAQSSEVSGSDATTGGEDGSEDLAQDEDAGLAPRAWTVVQICDRRDDVLPKVDEYQVRWARTRHPTAEFRISTARGRLRVKVGGRPWVIVQHTEASPNRRNGEPETIVEWANTWHTMWELSSAFPAIAEFERLNPRPTREITMGAKPDLRDWPLFLQDFKDPEPEPDVDDRFDRIRQTTFEIEEGIDYTESFLRYCKRELRRDGRLASPFIATLLCMPQRQRLKFNPEYVRVNNVFRGSKQNWRVLPVYIAGLAHREPCRFCATAAPERLLFEKCVNWDGIFANACVNCAYAGSSLSTTCECRSGPWTWKRNARDVQLPEVLPDAGDADSTPSEDGRTRSGASESSVDLEDTDDNFTPQSEHPSPTRGSDKGEGSNATPPRQSDGFDTHAASGVPLDRSIHTPTLHSSDAEPLASHGQNTRHEQTDPHLYDTHPGPNHPGDNISSDNIDRQPYYTSQGPTNASARIVRSTNGRFGVWSPDSNTSNMAPARPVVGLAVRPNEGLSERQLSKRPVPLNGGDAARIEDSQPKRTRRSTNDPADAASCLEDAAAASPPETFKCEPTSSASRPPADRQPEYDVSHHSNCSRRPRDRCVDPTVGFILPPYERFNPPTGVVYAHENKWSSGGLNDDNVKFIINRCPCTKTEYLNDAWGQMVRAKASNRHLSKYTLLSHRYSDELNLFIREYCPSQPQRPGEVIELD